MNLLSRFPNSNALLDRDIHSEVEWSLSDIDRWKRKQRDRSHKFNAFSKLERNDDYVIPFADITDMLSMFDRAFPINRFPIKEKVSQTVYDDQKRKDSSDWEGKSDYFKAKNPSELFKLAQAFISEFKQGNKIFGITGSRAENSASMTVWGLASAFNFMINKKAVIVADSAETRFAKFLNNSEPTTIKFEKFDMTLHCHQVGGITVVDINEFVELIFKLSTSALKIFFNDFSERSGAIFCALPELKQISSKRHLFVPLFESLTSVSHVVEKKSDSRNLTSTYKFFEKYGVRQLGVIFGKENIEY